MGNSSYMIVEMGYNYIVCVGLLTREYKKRVGDKHTFISYLFVFSGRNKVLLH